MEMNQSEMLKWFLNLIMKFKEPYASYLVQIFINLRIIKIVDGEVRFVTESAFDYVYGKFHNCMIIKDMSDFETLIEKLINTFSWFKFKMRDEEWSNVINVVFNDSVSLDEFFITDDLLNFDNPVELSILDEVKNVKAAIREKYEIENELQIKIKAISYMPSHFENQYAIVERHKNHGSATNRIKLIPQFKNLGIHETGVYYYKENIDFKYVLFTLEGEGAFSSKLKEILIIN